MRTWLIYLVTTFFAAAIASAQAPATTAFRQGEPAPAGFTFSRMWKGQELWPFAVGDMIKAEGNPDPRLWKEMGGTRFGFTYSGTGPLPAPREFVIKLDKPLPYGPAYRLFVKNFYRGKMEATLGDVTRPLEIKRYDWTPGELFEPNASFDKIVLRYFPSFIVADTGAKQEQYYWVQGVYLTSESTRVPIEGGEILETIPQQAPPAKTGNYLDNGSFEVGLFPWGKPFGVSGAYGANNLDASTAAHGKYSFKRVMKHASGQRWHDGTHQAILETRNYRLPPGSYSLSFHAKSDKPVKLTASLLGATEDLKGAASSGLGKSIDLTDQWQRYSIKADVSGLPGFLYSLNFSVESREPATIWLDAVQLQNGEATEFQPGNPTDVGYVCSTPGNVFFQGQGSDVDLLVHGTTGAEKVAIGYQVTDYWGEVIASGVEQVPTSDNAGKLTLKLPAAKTGLFRVIFSAGANKSEMVYSVVPANPHLNAKYPQGTLGADPSFGDHELSILKRANVNWVISKHLARWARTEREPGKYEFSDEVVPAVNRAKMMMVLQPLNLDWDAGNNQKWLMPAFRPKKGTGAVWEKKNDYMQAWGKFIYALVSHYKDGVSHWEIENEPNAVYTADEYAELLQVAIDNARRADPNAKIVAFSGGGYEPEFYDRVLQRVDPKLIDVFSVHVYTGNDAAKFREFAPLLDKYKKPAWNTETGSTCPTFFVTLPEYEEQRRNDYWQRIQREVRVQASGSVRNYLLSMSVGRMEKYFHYIARFVNAGPSQPTSRFGGGKELVEFDGSLRANGVALCIASHYIDGAKYDGPVPLDERLQMHVYQKGDSTVGFLFGRAEQTLVLTAPDGVSFFDIMGNPIEGKNLRVTDNPLYFTFKGEAESCRKRLSGMKVEVAK